MARTTGKTTKKKSSGSKKSKTSATTRKVKSKLVPFTGNSDYKKNPLAKRRPNFGKRRHADVLMGMSKAKRKGG